MSPTFYGPSGPPPKAPAHQTGRKKPEKPKSQTKKPVRLRLPKPKKPKQNKPQTKDKRKPAQNGGNNGNILHQIVKGYNNFFDQSKKEFMEVIYPTEPPKKKVPTKGAKAVSRRVGKNLSRDVYLSNQHL